MLDLALSGELDLITCPTLLDEIALVLARPRLRKYFHGDDAQRFLGDLTAQTILLDNPPEPLARVCRDPNDDYLVALATFAHADALVTGDQDLLVIDRPVAHVEVLTPRDFLERLH